MFIDKARIYVTAGRGGDGMSSFRREKYIPFGGPDGGNGGSGGNVYFVATHQIKTLLDFRYKPHFKAECGGRGATANRYGKQGKDLLIKIPLGTVVYKNGEFFHDFTKENEKVLVAAGGRGGRGNRAFKTKRNIAPRIYEKGQPGESATLDLELKLIADVGIAGCPNAGKSTFISKISSAHPKIAPYPFTTLSPNLGVAKVWDKNIVFADIPGLIKGSHQGKGLGNDFLRHIERTILVVHIVDGSVSPYENFKMIMNELKHYSKSLAAKPMVVAFNKMDIPESAKNLVSFRKKVKKYKIFPISALTGEGIKKLLDYTAKILDTLPKAKIDREEVKKFIYKPPYEVRKEGMTFVVTGKKIEDLAAMTDFNNEESFARFQGIIKKMGLDEELIKSGIKEGDVVKIGASEFEYVSS